MKMWNGFVVRLLIGEDVRVERMDGCYICSPCLCVIDFIRKLGRSWD